MGKASWQTPIQIAPSFHIAHAAEPVAIALTQTTKKCDLHRYPAGIAAGIFSCYVADDRDVWLLPYGPGAGLGPSNRELSDQLNDFAECLPDVHLVCHDREPSRNTLTEARISELRIQNGVPASTETNIRDAIPRARYLDASRGTQGFHVELELLLSLGERQLACTEVVDCCAKEIASAVAVAVEQATSGLGDLYNTEVLLQQIQTCEAMGVSLDALRVKLNALETTSVRQLIETLRARGFGGQHDGAAGLRRPGTSALMTILREVGAGSFGSNLTLCGDGKRAHASCPDELVPIGEYQGRPLYLDTRYQRGPMVVLDEREQWVEVEPGILGLLTHELWCPATD